MLKINISTDGFSFFVLLVFYIISQQHSPRLQAGHIVKNYLQRRHCGNRQEHSSDAAQSSSDDDSDYSHKGIDAHFVSYDKGHKEVVVNELNRGQNNRDPNSISQVVG